MCGVGPLIPRPAVTLIALLMALCIPLAAVMDYLSDTYSADKTILVLALLIAGIIGFDLRGGARRKGDDADA